MIGESVEKTWFSVVMQQVELDEAMTGTGYTWKIQILATYNDSWE